jgi:hypothetical protein
VPGMSSRGMENAGIPKDPQLRPCAETRLLFRAGSSRLLIGSLFPERKGGAVER